AQPMRSFTPPGRDDRRHAVHAVILGGGFAGLLTAKVLADRGAAVTIVERDRIGDPREHRPGVPQGRPGHVMLASGAEILERQFPSLVADLARAGAGKRTARMRYHGGGGYWRRVQAQHGFIATTRPVLEGLVRERVLALPNVCVIEGLAARAL